MIRERRGIVALAQEEGKKKGVGELLVFRLKRPGNSKTQGCRGNRYSPY